MNSKWMEKALTLARRAFREDEVPVGAIVVRGDEIIGRGYNQREKKYNPLAHAEIMAITAAAKKIKSWRLTGCSLIVTLEPCPMCLAAIQQARMDKVVFGARDPKGGALSLGYLLHEDNRINHRFKAMYKETEECGRLLREFFRNKRAN